MTHTWQSASVCFPVPHWRPSAISLPSQIRMRFDPARALPHWLVQHTGALGKHGASLLAGWAQTLAGASERTAACLPASWPLAVSLSSRCQARLYHDLHPSNQLVSDDSGDNDDRDDSDTDGGRGRDDGSIHERNRVLTECSLRYFQSRSPLRSRFVRIIVTPSVVLARSSSSSRNSLFWAAFAACLCCSATLRGNLVLFDCGLLAGLES